MICKFSSKFCNYLYLLYHIISILVHMTLKCSLHTDDMLTHKLILFQSMFVAIGSPEEMDKWDKMFEHEVTLDSPYCYNSLPWGV